MDDIRVVVLGVIAYVLLAVFPMDSLISKCVCLDKIPYADTIIKALVLGVILYAGRRLFV